MRIESISDFRRAIRSGPFTFPGGYPLYFIMADGEALSFKAARENRREILEALAHFQRNDSWRPVAVEINYEDSDLTCAHSGERIESAYGDSEAEEADEIREHMARAFFASAWADAAEEAGESLSGCEILDVMPDEIDPAAIRAAASLAAALERGNGKTLYELMAIVERDGDGDRENTAEMFGHYAAMQAMGHGVGLSDSFGRAVYDAIKVPYVEFGSHSLERDYFAETEDGDA